jgi:peptidyl-prolyl cis-trans isomerase C
MVRILLTAAVFLAGCRNSSDPVLAKVGSLPVRESEFKSRLSEVSPEYQAFVATPTGKRQFLDILIREKLILAAAGKSGIPKSKEFREELSRLRAEEEARLKEAREILLRQMWHEQLRAAGIIGVTEGEIREYHRRNSKEVQIRHIQCATPQEAEQALRVLRSGENFAALAKARSTDAATASNGGLLPPAIYGEIIPDLEDVSFRMHVGEMSGPIKSKFGYHVLRKDWEKELPIDAVRPRIARVLEKQKLDKHLQSLQDKFPVEVFDEQLK